MCMGSDVVEQEVEQREEGEGKEGEEGDVEAGGSVASVLGTVTLFPVDPVVIISPVAAPRDPCARKPFG